MLKGVLLQSYSTFGGGGIGEVLRSWEQAGFFAYVLPFLLIFALVFGVLTQIKLFDKSRAVNGIIALAVALMAIQFGFVNEFFAEIFPKLGIGIAIVLVAIILLGMFLPEEKWSVYTLFGIGAIVFIGVIWKTAGNLGWSSVSWWSNNWPTILGLIVVLSIIGIIVGSSTPQSEKTPYAEMAPPFFKNRR